MTSRTKFSEQVQQHIASGKAKEPSAKFEGSSNVVSTGSTLLDLAISGGRFERGGIPGGILVEIFGPSGCGKTVLLCELAGAVQRTGGEVIFCDPEARLNKQFSSIFGVDFDRLKEYSMPNTVKEVFSPIREWTPKNTKIINGIFADSLAALSTDMEMEGSDQYGMRRAKEFSEQLRLTCRVLTQHNLLMVCSNQVRQNLDAGPYGQKWKSPGGEAIGFYASLRLRCLSAQKIVRKRPVAGKEHAKVIGVETDIEVHKSSVWEPHHKASICIIYDYGIDDIRANLQYVKTNRKLSTYSVGNESLDVSLEKAITEVEEEGLEEALKLETIGLWHEIEEKFRVSRQPKRRD